MLLNGTKRFISKVATPSLLNRSVASGSGVIQHYATITPTPGPNKGTSGGQQQQQQQNQSNNDNNNNTSSTGNFKRYLLLTTAAAIVGGGAYVYFEYLKNEDFMFSGALPSVPKEAMDKYKEMHSMLRESGSSSSSPSSTTTTEQAIEKPIKSIVAPVIAAATTAVAAAVESTQHPTTTTESSTEKKQQTLDTKKKYSDDIVTDEHQIECRGQESVLIQPTTTSLPGLEVAHTHVSDSSSTPAATTTTIASAHDPVSDAVTTADVIVHRIDDKLATIESAIGEAVKNVTHPERIESTANSAAEVLKTPVHSEEVVSVVETPVNIDTSSSESSNTITTIPIETAEAAVAAAATTAAATASALSSVASNDATEAALKLLEQQYINQIKMLLQENIKLKDEIELLKNSEESFAQMTEQKLRKLYEDKVENNLRELTDDTLKKLQEMETTFKDNLDQNYQTMVASVQRQRDNLTQIFTSQQKAIQSGELEKKLVSTMTLTLVELKKVMNKVVPTPFVQQYATLKELAKSDDLLNSLLRNFPADIQNKGVASLHQLKEQFHQISPKVREIDLLPDDTSIIGRALSMVASKLILPEKGMVKGTDTGSTLARAEEFLKQGNLTSAVKEMESIAKRNPQIEELTHEWIATARNRVAVEDMVKLLEVKLKQVSTEIKGSSSSK
ncbi:hypothetical protein SAMD00019534_054670 [Acytostelium subglobosum LB1]|uniref:hypothetical protein n=1 Tax=Acytostelium subglobosum LB1 TaxID=1410327 RepID=UPI0006451960|nr:hypothetical protein SAMD00019534_054670 [Acytostelium subglobosum LB1]GAM22292.1 hypothetical protein SAMD00019534_054670 [Acytostelium subglobosum LB1]|eukprot:XP_012754412.1 hypothetical protein SAMD00019534_054670 [Acytostelium subglobosum LB1]